MLRDLDGFHPGGTVIPKGFLAELLLLVTYKSLNRVLIKEAILI